MKGGDLVQLKSGSPIMTIIWVDNTNQTASCAWYCTEEFKFKSQEIVLIGLVPAE